MFNLKTNMLVLMMLFKEQLVYQGIGENYSFLQLCLHIKLIHNDTKHISWKGRALCLKQTSHWDAATLTMLTLMMQELHLPKSHCPKPKMLGKIMEWSTFWANGLGQSASSLLAIFLVWRVIFMKVGGIQMHQYC